ncbi:unnamed protein product, partial [Didymodactylos carnosus]
VTNGPPAFQRIVSQILGPTRWQYSLAHLDDGIIYSQTFEQHLLHLDDILNRLNEANYRLNVDKCHIVKTTINFLGHCVEYGNIRPNSDNIRALLETQLPRTAKEAFRFVKAAEYYRKFIPGFTKIAQPLDKFAPTTKEQRCKKSKSLPVTTLSDDELNAFNELKLILTTDLVLRIPDEQLPFKTQIDASKIGIGAVLLQTHSNSDLSIAYFSRKLTSTEMHWPATEHECYAIVSAIEKWHKYLDGRPFVIETDHKPLLPFNLKQQLNSKCERWRLKLQQYQSAVHHIKGKHNTVADYLSRSSVDDATNDEDDYLPTTSRGVQTENSTPLQMVAPVVTRAQPKQYDKRINRYATDQTYDQLQQKKNNHTRVDHPCVAPDRRLITKNVTDNSIVPSAKGDIKALSPNDPNQITPFTHEQVKALQHQSEQAAQINNNIKDYPKCFLKDNMLMRKSSPPVPFAPKGQIHADIIKIYHDKRGNGAHFRRNPTTSKIKQRYFWPSMMQDIKNHVQSCLLCAQYNSRRCKPPGALKPIKKPSGVWQLLTMDFHGPITPTTLRGNKYIISLTDVLSKFIITRAVRDCTAETPARFIEEAVICKYGIPRCILTDNGSHFTSMMLNFPRSSQHSNSDMSSNSKKLSYYVTPLYKLDKLTQKYKPKKVIENDNYKQLCRTGECIPFQQPSSYHCYYIHHRTSMELLDELIDRTHQTTHYLVQYPLNHHPIDHH